MIFSPALYKITLKKSFASYIKKISQFSICVTSSPMATAFAVMVKHNYFVGLIDDEIEEVQI